MKVKAEKPNKKFSFSLVMMTMITKCYWWGFIFWSEGTIWDFVMLRHTYIICQSSQDDAISFEEDITCCVREKKEFSC